MPRSTRQSVDAPGSVQAATSAPQDVQVNASPTHAPIIRPETSMGQLVKGLSALEPGLQQYVHEEQQKYEKAETVKGMQARAEQGSNVDFSMLPEQSAFFQRGYMQMHGRVSAGDAARQMRSYYDENKLKPGFNPEQMMDEFTSKQTSGMNDPDALGVFLPELVKAKDAIRDDWATTQLASLRRDNDAQLQNRASFIASEKYSTSDLAGGLSETQLRHAKYQEFVDQGLALGKTRPEMATLFTGALVAQAHASHNPSILDAATIKDKNGISIVDNPALAEKVAAARDAVSKLQKQDIIQTSVKTRTEQQVFLEDTLRSDPMNPALNIENLYKLQGPYLRFNNPDGSDLAEFHGKVVKARQGHAEMVQLNTALYGADARIAAADPRAKPLIEARYAQVWDQFKQDVAAGKTDAVDSFLRTNLGFHQQWGVPDQRLKAYLSNINTTVDKDGKPGEDFVRAYQMFSAIKKSGNEDLLWDLTDDRSRTLLKYFRSQIEDQGIPQNVAFANAKNFNTPEAQERLKALATPEERQKARAKIEGALKGGSWYTFGLTGKAPNKDAFIAQLTDVYEQKLMTIGDREEALKQTLGEVENRFTRDSNDSWTVRPDATLLEHYGSRTDFDNGLKAYTLDLGKSLKAEGKITGQPEDFNLVRKGQGDAYVVMMHGAPAGIVQLEEIMQRGRASLITGDQAVNLSTLAHDLPKLGGDVLDQRWTDVMQLHAVGRIDSLEFGRAQAKRSQYLKQQLTKPAQMRST
jgi:hypothetical protein